MEVLLRNITSLIGVLVLLFSTGCQSNVGGSAVPAETMPEATVEADSVSITPAQGDVEMTPADPGLQNLIEMIKTDLANRLGILVEEVALVEATEVEWSDSSLDCPQAGMDYLQVITPGYRILVQADNQSYEYHTNRDTYFVYCENTLPKP